MADSADTTVAARGLGFDPDKLREKYRAERDKRLRADGNAQYQEVAGDFAHYLDDPYVEPGFTREPLTDEVEVVVIGGGFGGQLAAARLKEAGIGDVRIIEKGGDFGGTWYWELPSSRRRLSRSARYFSRRASGSKGSSVVVI